MNLNLNLWNNKDIFMTPTKMGSHRSSSWSSAPTDFNSMSDSQFLFGSQFCPENSQSAPAPLELSIQQRQDKGSQQNSQEVSPICKNDLTIFAKYQSKPQLFGVEGKENALLNNSAGRFKGVLQQFEENKKKIKEKYDNNILNTFILNTKESLQRFQSSFSSLEETLKSVLVDLGNLSKTMQETSQSHYGLLLNVLGEKNEMGHILLGMEKRLQDKDTDVSDLKSKLQLLKDSMEQLTIQQNEQHMKLCEQLDHMKFSKILADLQTFISASRETHHIKDSVSQTSPDMLLNQLSCSSHLSVLNISPGSKVISNKTVSENKENIDTQLSNHILIRGQSADKNLCTCCSSATIFAKSQEGRWLLTQEPHEATPMRKAIRRNSHAKGHNIVKDSQLNHLAIDNVLMQKHADDNKIKKLVTEMKINNKDRGSRVKQEKLKICSQKKKMYPSRKEKNCSKSTRANVKQEKTQKLLSNPEHHVEVAREPDSLWPLIVSEKKIGKPQERKAKKSKLVLLSHENKHHVSNLQKRTGIKKREFSNTKNTFCPHSSPESSLPQTQMKWLDLFDNYSITCSTTVPRNTTACCQLFFDSEYSD